MRTKRMLLGVIVVCIATLLSIGAFAQQGTDCRRRKPTHEGSLDLTGRWKDNSVNLEVDITQTDTNILGNSVVVAAKYLVPYKCEYPDLNGKAVMLVNDFTGELSKPNKGAFTTITGNVTICKWQKTEKEAVSEEVLGGMDLTVSQDGNSITGTFIDPVKGTQKISFTRLTQGEHASPYEPQGVIKTTVTAKLYQEPSKGSKVRYTVPPGTKLIYQLESTKFDAEGNPTWYLVHNGEGSESSGNSGYIPANQITCNKPNTKGPGPVSLLQF